jgi:ribosomal biogenesis protein LAS1
LISKAVKSISKLYLAYPSEVVSVLLEFFKLDDPDFCSSTDENHLENYDSDGLKTLCLSFNDMKTVVIKLSNKEPRIVLSMIKAVIEKIETQQNLKGTI